MKELLNVVAIDLERINAFTYKDIEDMGKKSKIFIDVDYRFVRNDNIEVMTKFVVDDEEGRLFNISLDFRMILEVNGDVEFVDDEEIEKFIENFDPIKYEAARIIANITKDMGFPPLIIMNTSVED